MLEVIGIVLVVQGVLSLFTDPVLMRWASGHQPWAGVVVGLVGLALAAAGAARRKKAD
ncbi:hypothetical protein [Streptoalloteichus hindustanus]|uniref:PEP-CTERM protein-sorting domain-containing protein n=1 Tax=Streptoalloteichus hindustanus TaxID=2017 RepID=A0A1M4UAC9_STRHI|nr:hypothetical protein [Streptoalloteichus hindustanus]SHE53821.1 hypothetical protein SAMN05444320_101358 [Streptoalloteichus hindustanus]